MTEFYVEYYICGGWQLFGTYDSELEAECWAETIRMEGREARVGRSGK